ncbi:hypothetical protein ABGB09_09850 [Streptomyces sp. B8F3]|uniref:hypothetical protein n=1 Tax=Streptomyces sp. B8F3 TaxID=3153573 RepID=UPI00325E6C65
MAVPRHRAVHARPRGGGGGAPAARRADRPGVLRSAPHVRTQAIKEGARPEPEPLHIGAALLVSAAGFTVFVRRQRTRAYPLIDFALFRNRQLLAGALGAGLAMFATAGVELILAQRLQLVPDLSPLHAGLVVAGSAIGAIPAGVVVGGPVYRVPTRHLIGGGLLVGAVGVAPTLVLTPGAGPLLGAGRAAGWVVPAVILTGLGLGAVMTAASAAITGGAPPHRAGMASSVEEVSFELGSLTGVAVLGSVLTPSTPPPSTCPPARPGRPPTASTRPVPSPVNSRRAARGRCWRAPPRPSTTAVPSRWSSPRPCSPPAASPPAASSATAPPPPHRRRRHPATARAAPGL